MLTLKQIHILDNKQSLEVNRAQLFKTKDVIS